MSQALGELEALGTGLIEVQVPGLIEASVPGGIEVLGLRQPLQCRA